MEVEHLRGDERLTERIASEDDARGNVCSLQPGSVGGRRRRVGLGLGWVGLVHMMIRDIQTGDDEALGLGCRLGSFA